jgi:hypothetical protein
MEHSHEANLLGSLAELSCWELVTSRVQHNRKILRKLLDWKLPYLMFKKTQNCLEVICNSFSKFQRYMLGLQVNTKYNKIITNAH